MVNWYLKRTSMAGLTVFAVITLSFVLIQLMPGGPAEFLRSQILQRQQGAVSEDQLNTLIQIYINIDPDRPLWQQYVEYMAAILQGDLGHSLWQNAPVSEILLRALPWTVYLMSVSMLLTFGIGIVLGAIMAYFEGSRFDFGMSSLATFLNSIPFYIVAILLIYFLAFGQNWFPPSGRYNYSELDPGFSIRFFASVGYHSILPIFSMVLTGFGGWALTMRGNSIQILGEDYLRVARLRGLDPSYIAVRYVGRNAILPMYTGLMISIGFMFGGSVILEEIFSYPGLGWYLFQAIEFRDYPLLMGGFLLITLAVVVSIFIADLTYGKIDPRVSRGDEREAY